MTNSLLQTSDESKIVPKPISQNGNAEEVEPVLLDWNQRARDPLAGDKVIELQKVEPVEHYPGESYFVKGLEELRHALGDAWRSMEQTVDDAVKSISSGREL